MTESKGPYYFANKAKDEIISGPTTPIAESLFLKEVQVGNGSGADASVAFGYKLPVAKWKAGQWDDSESVSYIDDTTHAQDATANNFALTTTTNNDGFVIQSSEKFNIVGLTVGTIQAGSPVFEYTYWNGSAWSTLATLSSPDFTAAADTYLVFNEPVDWAALSSADTPVATDGLTANYFAIRVRATTAPSTAPIANIAWVIKLLDYIKTIPNGYAAVRTSVEGIKVPPGHAIVPYCSTASSANWIIIEYKKGP